MEKRDDEKTILLVEDEEVWRDHLSTLLRRHGFDVITALDYTDAFNKIKRLDPSPILAIVDLKLPTSDSDEPLDGFHVLTALRKRGMYAIVVSGFTRKNSGLLAGREEVYDTVDKVQFASEDSFEYSFLEKIWAAISHARLDREAEGKLLQQQNRIRDLPLPIQE